MANYLITFKDRKIEGDVISAYLTIDHQDGIALTNISAESIGLSIANYGVSELSFDISETLLTPNNVKIVINDKYEFLKDILYADIANDIKLTYKYEINGDVEFSGETLNRTRRYKNRKLTCSFNVNTDRLFKATLIDQYNNNLNPLGVNLGSDINDNSTIYQVYDIIHRIFKHISEDFVYTFNQDWTFRTTENGINYDKDFYDIWTASGYWLNDKGFANNLGDLLQKIASFFCSQACLLSNETGFFRKLFYFSSDNLQTLGTVLSYEITEPYPKLKYAYSYQSSIDRIWGEYPNADAYTEIEGLYKKIDVNNYAYVFGFTTSGNRKILDLAKDPIFSEFNYYLALSARFYYYWLSVYNRVDLFTVKGLSYKYEKNFVYDSGKYQILKMKKELENGTTNIEAIYLGAA